MKRFRPNLAGFIVTLMVAPLLLWLAVWQYQRGLEKEELFAQFDQRADTPSVPLAQALASADAGLDALRFQPVVFEPEWQTDAPLVVLQNRLNRQRTGVWVYRLAWVESAGRWFLVNQGWLPTERGSDVPSVAVPEPELGKLDAQLSPFPQVGLRLGDVSQLEPVDGRIASPYIDAQLASQWLGEEVFDQTLRLTEPHPVYVRDWRPDLIPPERHFGYSLQWFSLFLTLLVIFVVMGFRRGRRIAQERAQ